MNHNKVQQIAINYLTTWCFIDLTSVIPFDYLFNVGNFNKISRFTRIGKISRLIRLAKILRVMKVAKVNKKVAKNIGDSLKISATTERLLLLLLSFLTMLHVICCTW
jgi:hypothetical protein